MYFCLDLRCSYEHSRIRFVMVFVRGLELYAMERDRDFMESAKRLNSSHFCECRDDSSVFRCSKSLFLVSKDFVCVRISDSSNSASFI